MLPLLIGAGLGGIAGLIKGKKNEEKMADQDRFRKAALTYSPWTGMGDPGALNLPGGLSSALGGAAMGALTGEMFGEAEGAVDPAVTGSAQAAAPSALGTLAGSQSAQGFGQMAAFSPQLMQQAGAMGSMGGSAGALGTSMAGNQMSQYLPYMMLANQFNQ